MITKLLGVYKVRVKFYKDYKGVVIEKMKGEERWFTEFYAEGIDADRID